MVPEAVSLLVKLYVNFHYNSDDILLGFCNVVVSNMETR